MVSRWGKKPSSGFHMWSLLTIAHVTTLEEDLLMGTEEKDSPKKLETGFRVMDPKRAREIQSMAGKKAHLLGKAHEWNSETSRQAIKAREDKKHGREKRSSIVDSKNGSGDDHSEPTDIHSDQEL